MAHSSPPSRSTSVWKSRNPVRVEPGRYTTILEPQAVCDFVSPLMQYMDRWNETNGGNEQNPKFPFGKSAGQEGNEFSGQSKLGTKVIDERITISADPMDPELGFPPFRVMQNLFDTSDPTEEMIATTERGLLVTRFTQIFLVDYFSLTHRGYTRDGVWLIEHGKISNPVKNMLFNESILTTLNNVEQLGTSQRAFHPETIWWWWNPKPVIVPPLKIRDFSFTSLSDAI